MMKLESFLRSNSPFKPPRSASSGRAFRTNFDAPEKPRYGVINSQGQRTVVSSLPSLSLPGRLRRLGPSSRIDPSEGGPKDIEPVMKSFVSSSPKLSEPLKLGSNMNVISDYTAQTRIRKKLTN